MISLYLAEDQSMLNTALSQLLNLEDNLEVVGTAEDGEKALEEIQRLKPDVAILDIEMPKLTGLKVAEAIRNQHLQVKLIILTTFAQKAYFEQAVRNQVEGYLLKDSPSDELIQAINSVMEGKTIYDPELVVNVVSTSENPLTERENEVLQVASNGISTKEISQQLFLSEGTVRNYFSAIFSKLGVHNRFEAVELAKKNKWIS
ncbi:response regulator transcription factor [Pediococcus stilesii]|uniref:Response regulator transcription factor n=1 Tax=Pediococcus stilesii TaxID=331679 RepID=A0A5R9BWV3_9LACO|nr:response regulator transcription factor [Pediococcus stilesii]TLQ05188.1 response regulator transcription factor [Pediococcus stilesii]